MTALEASRYGALVVGGVQLLANLVLLFRGFARLPAELAKEGASARIAELLRTAWIYGTLANVCISVTLLILASALREGDPAARRVVSMVGSYYLVLGITAYWFAPQRRPGLLAFSALGVALLVPLWL